MKNNGEFGRVIKEAGILFAITLIAGIVLGFVYELTKEPIRQQKELAIQKACQEVFEDADHFQSTDYGPSAALQEELAGEGVRIGTVYEACLADGSLAGYVVESTSSEGCGGNITLYVGVTLAGHLNGISILEISETPGLGMNADKVLVPQFADKDVASFTYTKSGSTSDSEIDAISGATFTTAAVTGAVNGALRLVDGELNGSGEGTQADGRVAAGSGEEGLQAEGAVPAGSGEEGLQAEGGELAGSGDVELRGGESDE